MSEQRGRIEAGCDISHLEWQSHHILQPDAIHFNSLAVNIIIIITKAKHYAPK